MIPIFSNILCDTNSLLSSLQSFLRRHRSVRRNLSMTSVNCCGPSFLAALGLILNLLIKALLMAIGHSNLDPFSMIHMKKKILASFWVFVHDRFHNVCHKTPENHDNIFKLSCRYSRRYDTYTGDTTFSSKTLSSNALSSKEHWSNGTLVEWNIGRTEHWSNGTFV